jgi:tRNA pseudouridine55 synthase
VCLAVINAVNSVQFVRANPVVKVKTIWQPVNGVFLLDKALGVSSNQALQQVRRVFKAAKAGHTGTLDPLATGLLPLCLGESSKFSQGLLDADKTYTARLCLGIMTATGDAEGAVLSHQPVQFTVSNLNAVIRHFTGALEQIPPMYSALKHQGKPLYELARQGIEIQRQPRVITVYELKVTNASFFSSTVDLNSPISIAAEAGQAWIDICATVSKGTYIRTLGQDIGAALGCGAHLSALRRTAIADWHVADAHELTALQAMNPSDLNACLLPVDSMLLNHPKIMLNSIQAHLFSNGGRVKLQLNTDALMPTDEAVRVYSEHTFLGLANLNRGVLHPVRLVGRQ